MNKKDALSRLSAIESEAAELRKIIEQPEPELPLNDHQGRYIRGPERGAGTFLLTFGGDVFSTRYSSDFDRSFLGQGGLFISREAAEKEKKRREMQQKLRKACADSWAKAGEVLDWGDKNQPKWYISLVPAESKICIFRTTWDYSPFVFNNKGDIQVFADAHTFDELLMAHGGE